MTILKMLVLEKLRLSFCVFLSTMR